MCTASQTQGSRAGRSSRRWRRAEPGLHDAVLAGVVREHRARPPGGGGEAGIDGGGQHVELAVHRDPDGLERALGRMAAAAAGRRRDGVADDLGELGGGGHGRAATIALAMRRA